MAIDIGLIGYNAYCKSLGDKAAGILAWGELDQETQDAWRAAGVAALEYGREQYDKDLYEDAKGFPVDW